MGTKCSGGGGSDLFFEFFLRFLMFDCYEMR